MRIIGIGEGNGCAYSMLKVHMSGFWYCGLQFCPNEMGRWEIGKGDVECILQSNLQSCFEREGRRVKTRAQEASCFAEREGDAGRAYSSRGMNRSWGDY